MSVFTNYIEFNREKWTALRNKTPLLLSEDELYNFSSRSSTDGFLYPKDTLEKKRLMSRKGFPESYDTQKLIDFM
jgi:pantothenate kinase